VRDIWAKLLKYRGDETDFFLSTQSKVAKNLSEEKAALLLQDLNNICKEKNDIETAIIILKMILKYDEKDTDARNDLVECFRKKYAEHSQLEIFIKDSNI
jgi:transcription elongation factor GreA-like protein